jgi:hypothetical protein
MVKKHLIYSVQYQVTTKNKNKSPVSRTSCRPPSAQRCTLRPWRRRRTRVRATGAAGCPVFATPPRLGPAEATVCLQIGKKTQATTHFCRLPLLRVGNRRTGST